MKDMGKKGYVQGEMNPTVDSYQKPESCYSQAGFSRTTEYIERQDAHQKMAANDIRKQDYKGRYS